MINSTTTYDKLDDVCIKKSKKLAICLENLDLKFQWNRYIQGGATYHSIEKNYDSLEDQN